jgi:hypothetical protein
MEVEYRVERKSNSSKFYVLRKYLGGVRREIESKDLTLNEARAACAEWNKHEAQNSKVRLVGTELQQNRNWFGTPWGSQSSTMRPTLVNGLQSKKSFAFLLGMLLGIQNGAFTLAQQQPFDTPQNSPSVAPLPFPNAPVPSDALKGSRTQEIPQIYLGCWQARIGQPDSWSSLGGPPIIGWVPETHTICFRRSGEEVRVTFQTVELDETTNQGRVLNFQSEVYIMGSKGDEVSLRYFSSDQQHPGGVSGPMETVKIDGAATCTMLPGGRTMIEDFKETHFCSGAPDCNSGPYMTLTSHGVFHRIADPGFAHESNP